MHGKQTTRISNLAAQLQQQRSSKSVGISPSPTRSWSDYAKDAVAITTKNVVQTERHGGQLVAEVLAAHDVNFIFCLSGGHISPFLVASNAKGIRIVDVRHEVRSLRGCFVNAKTVLTEICR
jgi:hypothetical protein